MRLKPTLWWLRSRQYKNGPKVVQAIKPINNHFTASLDFHSYRLHKQPQQYNSCIFGKIGKWPKCIKVQMKSAIFKPSDLISTLSFLHNVKNVCNCNGIHKSAAMWLVWNFFLETCQGRSLTLRISWSQDWTRTRRTVELHWQVVNYLLQSYKPMMSSPKLNRKSLTSNNKPVGLLFVTSNFFGKTHFDVNLYTMNHC